jgi:enamine deaminase RidA (YjgF/YER057c/UK114 family)
MITRVPDGPTRAESVAWDKLVFTVAVADDNTRPMYEQTREALATIDRNLVALGSHKSRILTAIVYIADMARKAEMNRAWDEWADRDNPAMRACLGVALTGGDLVEIVITAARA